MPMASTSPLARDESFSRQMISIGRRFASRLALAVLIAATCGCGESGPQLAPATGQVLLDGEPVADAGVLFAPTSSGPAASASTDADGNFSLMTGSREGALVANHRVVISKSETRGVNTDSEGLSGVAVDGGWLFVDHLPTRYNDPNTSGLTAEVVAGGENHFTFELTSVKNEQN